MPKIQSRAAELKYEYSKKAVMPPGPGYSPLAFFERWFEDALRLKVPMANAMTLATVSGNKKPHARIVLLKDYGRNGFSFFTNYNSAKGQEIKDNPHAALVFYWPKIERQIRIEGKLKKTGAKVSDAYFYSRPHNYQLGAWVSHQSRVTPDRKTLATRYTLLEKQYKNRKIPRPPYWGGYVLTPALFEFWHGKASRLHDRLLYKKMNGKWKHYWLEP